MVSIYSIKNNTLGEKNLLQVELRGLSTDTKPTTLSNGDIENGSVFIEIDTQKVYIYDGKTKEWLIPTITQSDSEDNNEENNENNEENAGE